MLESNSSIFHQPSFLMEAFYVKSKYHLLKFKCMYRLCPRLSVKCIEVQNEARKKGFCIFRRFGNSH